MPSESPLAGPTPWDLVAGAYAAEVAPMLTRFAERAVERAAVRSGARVLDVATGPGTLAFVAAAAGGLVDAVDFSPEMLARLHERIAREGVSGITPRVGDGMSLPYPDGTFDAAFSMFGVMFFPDRGKGLTELRRVLSPGGRAVVSSWVPLSRVPLLAALFDALRPHVPLPPSDGTAPLGDLSTMQRELEGAGFRRVVVEEVGFDMGAPTVRDFWPTFTRTTAPLVLFRRSFGEDAWAKVEQAVLAELGRTVGDAPQPLRMVANLGMGEV